MQHICDMRSSRPHNVRFESRKTFLHENAIHCKTVHKITNIAHCSRSYQYNFSASNYTFDNHLLSPSRQRKRKPSVYKRLELLIFLLVRYFMSFLRFSFTAYAVELILLRTIRFQPALRRTVPPCSLQYLRLLSSLLYRHTAVFSPPSCGRRKVLSCCPCC